MKSILYHNKNKGFTLVELSIVLVVIGLITAGIVGGGTLVKKAKFRSVIGDITKFTTATTTFKTQYGAFPGDMPNATAYWGTGATGVCPNGLAPTGCNGNGDGVIETENLRFWQHLTLSGYLPGTYSGVIYSGIFQPASQVNSAYYRVICPGLLTVPSLYLRRGCSINLEGNDVYLGSLGVILAEDASYSIDLKMDDGVADKGNVYATTPDSVTGSATECTTGSWLSSSGSYNLNIKNKYCRMAFWF